MDSLSLDGAREALNAIPPQCSRTDWIKFARVIFDEFGEDGFGIWDAWSSNHPDYVEKKALQAWKSAIRTGGGRAATIATLIYDAKRNGWKPTRKHNAKRDESAQRAHEEARARRRAELQAAEAAAQAAAALRAAELWAGATLDPADHPYLQRKRVAAYGIRRAAEWAREWVDPESGEVHTWRDKDALIVPIWSCPGVLTSLQAILPARTIGRAPRDGEKDQRRDKDYLRDGKKHGCYCVLGRVKDATAVIVCEGYATGASLHEATGYPVMVAFDAGNLQPVAEALRAKLPDVRIVIAADNDQFHAPRGGKSFNPGVEAATEAAKDCKGVLAVPQFESLDGEPSDFNDLAREQGADAVRAAIDLALNPPVAAAPAAEPPPWVGDVEPAAETVAAPTAAAELVEAVGDDEVGAPAANGHFAILGYDHGDYYVFVHAKRQLMVLHAAAMGVNKLLELAPLNWWEMHFESSSDKVKFDATAAANFVINTAHARGIYDPTRVRGRGAWVDEGRIVFHHGGHLSVDGAPTDITAIKSRYVYELNRALPDPADEAMTSDEGEYLLGISERFRWTMPGSAALLLGWIALAPVCGAVPWRPHLWLTGGAGSGKAQPHSARVLTPSGWRTMGQIRPGDYVTTPDNGYGKVIGLFPQGSNQVYKLTFADGRTTRATGDHLWKARVKHAWRLKTTDEMREILSRDTRAAVSLAVPLSDPLTISANKEITKLPMHPYALGVLLGDGHFASEDGSEGGAGPTGLTCYDPEIANRVGMLLPEAIGLFEKNTAPGQFRLGDLSRYGRKTRELIKELRLLGTKSHDKFIPPEYLEASIADRVELLKGLMDTDGYVGGKGGMSFCTTSPHLRDGVVRLVRSLGGIASVVEKSPTYTHRGEKLGGRTAYNINIRLRDRAMAFHLQRKVDRAQQRYQYADCLYLNIESIEPDGYEECSCIAIDHPDRLYVTDEFVVTHNTTVLSSFTHYLLGGADVYALGKSTEPGIRQELRNDARPVTMDESESNEDDDVRRVQNILGLIRQASSETGAKTYKGTASGQALSFDIRSMFCLASIQVALKQKADIDRLTVLGLRSTTDAEKEHSGEEWRVLRDILHKLHKDVTLPARLLRRTIDMLPITLQNIVVFSDAAADRFGSQRDGDQYGTMLAGTWSLISTGIATREQAMELIDRYDWSEHRELADVDESQKALSALMEAHIRIDRGIEVTVFELVCAATGKKADTLDMTSEVANGFLQRYGLKVREGYLMVSNTSVELKRLMHGTGFEADIRGSLLRVAGACKGLDGKDGKPRPEKFAGVVSKVVALPLRPIVGELPMVVPF